MPLEPWPSLTPDLVPRPFRQAVRAELRAVHQDVVAYCKDVGLVPPPDKPAAGRCAMCGGLLDDFTPGCVRCRSRHNMRRTASRRGVKENKPRLEPKWRWGEGTSRRTMQRRAKALANQSVV